MKPTLESKINPHFYEIVFRQMLGEPLAINVVNTRLELLETENEGKGPNAIDAAELKRNRAIRAFLADDKPKTVMICGELDIGQRTLFKKIDFMLGQIRRWYAPRKWSVICGDDSAVDRYVINAALQLQLPITVYGVQPKSKIQHFPDAPNITYKYISVASYIQRDHTMALECDYSLFFSDVLDEEDTKAIYKYVKSTLGKPALLLDPSNTKA